ncbi:MAG: flagellar hook-length control protein FliK, partial [Actinomycetota bacterium]
TVQIDKQVKDGADTVKINLKPVELGKIEIKLEVGPEGRVSATITADRPETLAVLQKDAKGLEKALGDAGLKADSQAMSFNLRGEQQQNADRGNNSDRRSGRSRGRAIGAVDDTRGLGGPAAAQPRLGGRSGVDISV